MTTFTTPLNLIIDYHVEDDFDSSDPFAHRPPQGRTAAIVRLMTDNQLSLTKYKFDVVLPVADAEELWDGINANLEYVLWRTPAMYNTDIERLVADGYITEAAVLDSSVVYLNKKVA